MRIMPCWIKQLMNLSCERTTGGTQLWTRMNAVPRIQHTVYFFIAVKNAEMLKYIWHIIKIDSQAQLKWTMIWLQRNILMIKLDMNNITPHLPYDYRKIQEVL